MKRLLVWSGLSCILAAGCGASGGSNKPAEYRVSPEEQQIIGLSNEARAQENIAPYNLDLTLCQVARAHSARLAKAGRSSVTDGKVLEKALQDSGYAFDEKSWGFAGNKFKEGKLGNAFAGLLKDKESAAMVLQPEFRDMGVGIAANEGKTEFFLTQVFATKRSK